MKMTVGTPSNRPPWLAFSLCLVLGLLGTGAHEPLVAPAITVVNMIPELHSGETAQNSEPSIGVHPFVNGAIAASAVILDAEFCPPLRYPILLSLDEGQTWNVACVTPQTEASIPIDMTVRFARNGRSLYEAFVLAEDPAGFVGHFTGNRKPLDLPITSWLTRLTDETSSFSAPRILSWVPDVDQPQAETSPLPSAPSGLGAALVLKNAAATCPAGGAVSTIVNAWAPPPAPHTEICLVSRPSEGTVPAVRVAIHEATRRGYAVFYRPVIDALHWDVVVMRHENLSANAFTSLRDKPITVGNGDVDANSAEFCSMRDGNPGYRVARCILYPNPTHPDVFGQERRFWSQLAIAVNPTNSKKVYIAWADSMPGHTSHLSLHFASSTDGGASWTISPLTVDNATNPAIAVASDGAIGTMYQQLVGTRWQTWFALTQGDETSPLLFKLAETPSDLPVKNPWIPTYLGDYIQLQARGKNFYGVFSASNDRSVSTFYPGTIFQRHYAGSGKPRDASGSPVDVSIDPYFVKVVRP